MARSPRTFALAADTITIEGALIAPAMLARVAAREAEGQSDADYKIPKGLTLRDEIARYFRIGHVRNVKLLTANPGKARVALNPLDVVYRAAFMDPNRVEIHCVLDHDDANYCSWQAEPEAPRSDGLCAMPSRVMRFEKVLHYSHNRIPSLKSSPDGYA